MPDPKVQERLECLRIERRLIINMAERDVQFGDGWLCGYDVELARVNKKIADLIDSCQEVDNG